MKNIKKLGLTALAGSLVATSAYSADMAVTGGVELTYTTTSGSTKAGVDGNQWGFEKGIGWSATGEVMGYDVTLATTLTDDASLSSSSLTFDLGDMGKVYVDHGAGKTGIGGLENKGNVSAYEEADHGMTDMHQIDVNGAGQVLGYSSPAGMLIDGLDFSVEIIPSIGAQTTNTTAGATSGAGSTGSEWNTAVNYAVPMVDGLNLYFGYANESSDGTRDDDTEMTIGFDYTMGPVKIGYQHSEVEDATAAADEVTAYGLNFAVNDDLTVSYSVTENEVKAIGATASSSAEATGINAAYSVGGGSLRIFTGETDNAGYTAGKTQKLTEISLSMSF
tara:strand:- start:1603 stop:2604 length:1002 start_codon:yes stop_codon:yes gene_type:complete